jgi:HEPN domain-containing protein
MKSPLDLARDWLCKAESDLQSARLLAAGPGPFDTACFHCQQAVEKYLKGYLAARSQQFPFTHDLGRLAVLCDGLDPTLQIVRPDVIALTDYAVKLRYDNEFWPVRQDVEAALVVVHDVRSRILAAVPPQARP